MREMPLTFSPNPLIFSVFFRANTQFEKVDISELTWEQKERVLRLLFAKMNDTNLWKYSRDLSTSTPAPADAKEENIAG